MFFRSKLSILFLSFSRASSTCSSEKCSPISGRISILIIITSTISSWCVILGAKDSSAHDLGPSLSDSRKFRTFALFRRHSFGASWCSLVCRIWCLRICRCPCEIHSCTVPNSWSLFCLLFELCSTGECCGCWASHSAHLPADEGVEPSSSGNPPSRQLFQMFVSPDPSVSYSRFRFPSLVLVALRWEFFTESYWLVCVSVVWCVGVVSC